MNALSAILSRDLRLALRVGGGAPMTVIFFISVAMLLPFAIGPDPVLLRRIGPAMLWIAALLATLLALDRLFAIDHEDGSLDLILMGRTPLELVIGAKALSHWMTAGLPLVLISPALGLFLNLEQNAMVSLALTLLVGTPTLTFIGTIGAALSVSIRRGGVIVAVLVVPLTIPVLIFGIAASNAVVDGAGPFGTPFTLLCGLMLGSLVIGPFAAAAALRHGSE
jgi:heme exporter protein B